MHIVHVFDIATKAWFAQPTTAQDGFYPSTRNSFCSVVGSAEDNSSHNIYIYAGWGFDDVEGVINDIYILTLPAFHWVKVYPIDKSDTNSRYTSDHECQKLYEKHMVVYGGITDKTCDNAEGSKKFQRMMIYDMSSLKWTTTVELENQKYLVPEVLYKILGGKLVPT